jgi:hypothetical protein
VLNVEIKMALILSPLRKCVLILLLFLSCGFDLLPAEEQGWLNNSLTFQINPRFTLKLTQEIRSHTITYMDAYLFNLQGGLVYHLPYNFYIAFFYKRQHVKIPESIDLTTDAVIPSDDIFSENRFTLEAGWKTKLSQTHNLDCRLKTEIRRFEPGLDVNHTRFRLRVRLKTVVTLNHLRLTPFIAIEPFVDSKKYRITRSRFYLGTGIVLGRNAALIVNYINQATESKPSIHILNSGVELTF